MLRFTSLLFVLSLISILTKAQQAAVFFQQTHTNGSLKSCRYVNNAILYTNGKNIVIQDALGTVRNNIQLNISDDAIIKNISSVNGEVYLLYQIITSGGKVQFSVLKLNDALQVEWYKTFGVHTGSLNAYSLATDEQALYIANNNCTNGLTITKLAKDGSLIWNKTWHTSNGTIVPGYLDISGNQLTIYSKYTYDNTTSLAISTIDMNGSLINTDRFQMNNPFYIRNVINDGNKTYVLVNYSDGSVTSELITLNGSNAKGAVFQASTAIQLNDMVMKEHQLYLSGNIYINQSEHLNAILLSINSNQQLNWIKQFGSTLNQNIGYDDALSIESIDETIIVNGVNADRGFTLSFTEDKQPFCLSSDVQNVALINNLHLKTSYSLSEGSTPNYNIQPVLISSQMLQPSNNEYCSYELLGISTAINETAPNSELSLSVYPNPTKSYINIGFNNEPTLYQWDILDLSGRVVLDGKSDKKTLTLDLASVSTGMYLFRWNTTNNSGVSRFMISR